MTTIVWDTHILAGDTLVGGDYSDYAPGFFDDVEWSISPKIFMPAKTVTYEGSPIIAVGGAGNVGAGNALIDYLLDRTPDAANPRPVDLKAADFLNYADATLSKLKEDSWLLILTENNCWYVESVLANGNVSIDDVTYTKTAIGAGAPHALASLAEGLDAIDSILDAASHPTSVTNFQILYVEHKPGTLIKRAWRSHTTVKDPVRRNRLMKRSLAVAGSLLTGVGGWPLHAEVVTGFWQGAAVLACLAGLVLTGWSMLTSLVKTKNAFPHVGALLVALVPLAFPDGEAFIVKHNLADLYLIYGAALMVLVVIRMNWESSTRPRNALGITAGLTTVALLLTVSLINSTPFDLGVILYGMAGVALGSLVTWNSIRYMQRNYQAFKEYFVR